MGNSFKNYKISKSGINQKTGVYKSVSNPVLNIIQVKTSCLFQKRFNKHTPKKNTNLLKSNLADNLVDTVYTDFQTDFKVLRTCRKGRYKTFGQGIELYKTVKFDLQIVLNDKTVVALEYTF